eukprot:SAG22_NODE_790_length_7216_cov_5.198820_9_plen_97_part_00
MAGSAASTVMLTKFIATHFVYIGLNIRFVVVGEMKGGRAHAFNAITATFTIAVGALVKSCANRLEPQTTRPNERFVAGVDGGHVMSLSTAGEEQAC